MKEFKITDAETGQTLLKYLSKILPLAPISLLHKSLRKKNITINHKKCSGKEILGDSDIVQIWFSDETFSLFSKRTKKYSPKKRNFNFAKKHIIYEDEHIIIVNKPAGILTQGDESGEFTLNDALLEYCNFENDSTAKPSVCNRLDRNTGGLILCGKTISGLQTLNEIIKNRSLLKKYHCIVFGKTKKEETLKSFLTKSNENNKVTISNNKTNNSLPIETRYKRISMIEKRGFPCSLLEVQLVTGRSHQIRAHLSFIGHPILGDKKYGTKESIALSNQLKINHQLLQAFSLTFPVLQGKLSYLSKKTFILKNSIFTVYE
ncbi:MAG: RluA family pseudouridine synthase [Dialister sp.]|nr:RluA family pseudouridine synthase [Dialister sp.]